MANAAGTLTNTAPIPDCCFPTNRVRPWPPRTPAMPPVARLLWPRRQQLRVVRMAWQALRAGFRMLRSTRPCRLQCASVVVSSRWCADGLACDDFKPSAVGPQGHRLAACCTPAQPQQAADSLQMARQAQPADIPTPALRTLPCRLSRYASSSSNQPAAGMAGAMCTHPNPRPSNPAVSAAGSRPRRQQAVLARAGMV